LSQPKERRSTLQKNEGFNLYQEILMVFGHKEEPFIAQPQQEETFIDRIQIYGRDKKKGS
jgi:hypothetical protein